MRKFLVLIFLLTYSCKSLDEANLNDTNLRQGDNAVDTLFSINGLYPEDKTYLNDTDFKQIEKGANSLLSATNKDDLILFVGRSPHLFKYYWEIKNVDRRYLTASFSGHPYKDNKDNPVQPDKENILAYQQYLKNNGIEQKILQMIQDKNQLILFDYAITGEGIANFAKLLTEIYPDIVENRIQFKFIIFSEELDEKYKKKFEAEIIPCINSYFTNLELSELKVQFIYLDTKTVLKITDLDIQDSGLCYFPASHWNNKLHNPLLQKQNENLSKIKQQALNYWTS